LPVVALGVLPADPNLVVEARRHPLAAPPRLNQTWALDFMTETLYDGRRTLTDDDR
jgi:hypothetical protein